MSEDPVYYDVATNSIVSEENLDKIDVLPCVDGVPGYVRLVDHMGSDLSVSRSARVSYNADWRDTNDEKNDEKLINYLWKNKHTTPFESVTFTFEVKAPIFVFRQWHRHRTWAINEISGRYTELDMGYYVPNVEQITTQSASNKQMRTNEQHPQASVMQDQMRLACNASFAIYRDMVSNGCPRELARSVLPVATYSRMFATVSLMNLFKFITLRSHDHAQYEIRTYSDAMFKLIEPIVPVCAKAFHTHK